MKVVGCDLHTRCQQIAMLGHGDRESFQYDPNSGRMTNWTSAAGTNSQAGTLTWNPNGTLQSLLVTGQPTCSYAYDDLARLAGINCGGGNWAQNFGYDFFNNLTKAVPTGNTGTSFQPTYGAGNHISSVGSQTIVYDNLGNTKTDNLGNAYLYDAESRPQTVNGLAMTVDAMNRTVEMQTGSGSQEILYTATGQKFALMNGQTVQKYFVPLTAGIQAVYNASGLQYYRHADWLGSSRFGGTPTGGVQYTLAYAPFGETTLENGTVDRSYTGQTQDTVAGSTGLYDFQFRQHASSQGRWLVPDPAGLAAVDPTNPQTWNRYAYVGNSPLNTIDPLGLQGAWHCAGPHKDGDCDPIVRIGSTDLFGGIGELSILTTAYQGIRVGILNSDHVWTGQVGYIYPNIGMLDLLGQNWNGAQYTFKVTVNAKLPKTIASNSNDDVKAFHWGVGVAFGLNYCGPGGTGGEPTNGVDAACLVHDRCYRDAGINWMQATTGLMTRQQQQARKACDAKLCSALPLVWTESSNENAAAFFVGVWFNCVP
jgi:RHS repeat-associated protein